MRPTWRLTLCVVVLVLAGGSTVPLGAAGRIQQCDGPLPPAQSGRARITPGLNALKSPQQVALTVSLFSCSPAFATRGAGTLTTTVTIKAGQTCSLLSHPHQLLASATIKWKDDLVSIVALTFSLRGTSHNVDVSGTVSHGLFKNHRVTVEFHYTDVVSSHGGTPSTSEVGQACRNKTPPKTHGRISINGLTFVTTKPFIIS
jgi:hypothetical protein